MERKNKLIIISTFANDTFIDEMNGFLHKQKGGPAFYLTNTFTMEGIQFDLRCPSIVGEAEILIRHEDELGKIVRKPDQLAVPFATISSPFLAVSTLLDEINLDGLPNFNGKIFLDVQGYVRDGDDFGKKKEWRPTAEMMDAIFCLKGTTEELHHIPAYFLEKQKNKILIETKAEAGCTIFTSGKRVDILPSHQVSGADTVGAGDTFFAYFISQYIRSEDVCVSGAYAVEKTIGFLETKRENLSTYPRGTRGFIEVVFPRD